MNKPDPPASQDIDRLKLFIYLVPIFGFFPALLSLYRRKESKPEQALSRLVVTLALGWLVAYILLGTGAQISEASSLRLLVTSSLLTTGYFLTNLWLMVRLWRRRSVRLPGLSKLSDRLR